MTRILVAAILLAATVTAAPAKIIPGSCDLLSNTCLDDLTLHWPRSFILVQGIGTGSVGNAGGGQQPAPVVVTPAPAAQQNTITTTAPVSSQTTISVGTLAGQLLNWVVLAFSGPIGGMILWVLVRFLKKLGIDATDALRARLQEIIVNGLNVGAKAAEDKLRGKGQIEIKNAAIQGAVIYAQTHGADTIRALGLDPQSGAAVEAIKARIETAINDPTIATAPVLDGAKVATTPVSPALPARDITGAPIRS